MAIINRLARLFKADLHAVLDHMEEPELQLKQAIREMTEQRQLKELEVRNIKTRQSDLSSSKQSAEKLLLKTNNEIAVCFDSDNENLARGLIRRKLETKAFIQSLEIEIDKAEKFVMSVKKELEEFDVSLNSMKQKAALMPKQQSNQSASAGAMGPVNQIKDSDVEVALLQERRHFDAQLNGSKAD